MVAHTRKTAGLDARGIQIHFSAKVRSAFADLAAAVHNSDHFDKDALAILQDWAVGKSNTVHDVLTAFPLIAEEVSGHIRATDDKLAERAWRELALRMPENGFTLGQSRLRTR